MNNKLIIVLLLGAFAAGRYLTPTKIEIKTVEVEKKETETEKVKHQVTTTTTEEKPDGTKETKTVITQDSDTKKQTQDDINKSTVTTKQYGGGRTRIAAIGAISTSSAIPFYGVEASHSILGPISGGAMVLTNGTFGVSLGLEF